MYFGLYHLPLVAMLNRSVGLSICTYNCFPLDKVNKLWPNYYYILELLFKVPRRII